MQNGVEKVSYSKQESEFVLRWAKKIKAINSLGGKCQKCGESNVFSLCFHHRDDKDKHISTLLMGRWSKVVFELKKCDLLCSNCHIELHHEDGNLFKREILEGIKRLSCVRCGYTSNNLASLSFHHVDPKSKRCNVGNMFRSWRRNYSIKAIMLEIEKCEVICENCHRMNAINIGMFSKHKERIYDLANEYAEPRPVADENEIVVFFKNGISVTEIAQKLNIYTSTVSRVLSKYGLNRKFFDKDKILGLRAEGIGFAEIARILGCSDAYVRKVVKLSNKT